MTQLGSLSLWLAFLFSAWGASLGAWGALSGQRALSASGERGVHAAVVFVALSVAGLAYALATGDLTYRYVASWSSSFTPLPYRLGAVWAGPAGALLIWAFALGAGASIASWTLRPGSALRAWTSAVLALLVCGVLAMACVATNPFERLAFAPDDGRGLPLEWARPVALLQMPFGYVAMALVTVPAVMTVMGSTGRAAWRADARRWAVGAWALVSAAMLLDLWRRYADAAWSGDWRWAPVHAGTAFAWAGASLLVVGTHRQRSANASLGAAFAAFALTLVGLELRRAFGWDGVHDFANSAAGRAAAWLALAAVLAGAAEVWRAERGVRTLDARAMRISVIALCIACIALTTSGFARTQTLELREGDRARITDRFGVAWTLSLEGVSTVGRESVIANVIAVRAAANGHGAALVTSELRSRYAGAASEPTDQMRLSGRSVGMAEDLRVDVREATDTAAFIDVRFVPLAVWVWVVGAVAVLAALVAALGRQAPDAGLADGASVEIVGAGSAAGA